MVEAPAKMKPVRNAPGLMYLAIRIFYNMYYIFFIA
jgi:hypothetical protein